MAKRKPPALTSPGKIGFFVSLMIVLVSIGITYNFFHAFDLSWTWVRFDNGKWSFDLNALLTELVPLIGILLVTSWLSFVLIAGAVRRYKIYLDSGLDYKNLLTTIRELEDLDDEEKLEKLQKHPDLKQFLVGTRQTLSQKLRVVEERERELVRKAVQAKQSPDATEAADFATQCETLITAIRNQSGGNFKTRAPLSIPELARVEEAVRVALRSASETALTSNDSAKGSSYAELQKAGENLQNQLKEIIREVEESARNAKEIEKQLNNFKSEMQGQTGQMRSGPEGAELLAIMEAVESFDELSGTLHDLGEEAKGIAIGTALHAGSGKGTQADFIKLAEDIKEVAARFKRVAKSYHDLTSSIKVAVQSLGSQEGGATADSSHHAKAIGMLAGKTSLWVERVMILLEKINHVKETYQVSASRSAETTARQSGPSQWGGGNLDLTGDGADGLGIEKRQGPPSIFSNLETEDGGIFSRDEEVASQPSEDVTVEDEFFADLSGKGKPRAEKPSRGDGADFLESGTRQKSRGSKSGIARPDALELETFSRNSAASADQARKKKAVPAGGADDEDDVVDLYVLGAVDYDPGRHSA